jgi:hypothetical protein
LPLAFVEPAGELSQGDLLLNVPSVYVTDLRYMVERGDAENFRLTREAPRRREDRAHQGNVLEMRKPGVILTHDCEIDKEPTRATLLVGAVRPIAAVNEADREGFRSNTRHRALYLPESPPHLPEESYLDLRCITVLRRDALEQCARVASMNEDGRRLLREQLFRFFTRRYLPDGWVAWPEEDR